MSNAKSQQLPSTMVAEQFGEVNIQRLPDGRINVLCTVMMTPTGAEAEGWQTGVALDASGSMRNWYGKELQGKMPPELQQSYVDKGWITKRVEDGRESTKVAKEAYKDAMDKGHLKLSQNIVEQFGRQFIGYLAAELDADGGTTVIYWAGGADGSECEVVGDFTADECKSLAINGPKGMKFGNGTRLVPAVKYFVDRFRDAKNGMYIFLTDGRLDDLEEVKSYSVMLAREIAAGRRYPVKFVLVGMGDEVDEAQMEALDDLDSGTNVDLWDHKIAAEMRSTLEIFAEVVSENQFVAASGVVYDSNNNIVKRFSDGLPSKIVFQLPPNSTHFELDVEGLRIRQSIVVASK